MLTYVHYLSHTVLCRPICTERDPQLRCGVSSRRERLYLERKICWVWGLYSGVANNASINKFMWTLHIFMCAMCLQRVGFRLLLLAMLSSVLLQHAGTHHDTYTHLKWPNSVSIIISKAWFNLYLFFPSSTPFFFLFFFFCHITHSIPCLNAEPSWRVWVRQAALWDLWPATLGTGSNGSIW